MRDGVGESVYRARGKYAGTIWGRDSNRCRDGDSGRCPDRDRNRVGKGIDVGVGVGFKGVGLGLWLGVTAVAHLDEEHTPGEQEQFTKYGSNTVWESMHCEGCG